MFSKRKFDSKYVVTDQHGHPRLSFCNEPTGYCPDLTHRLAAEDGFTRAAHRVLARTMPLTADWVDAVVDVANVARRDAAADARLRHAAAQSLAALSLEIRAQGLHTLYGLRKYMGQARSYAGPAMWWPPAALHSHFQLLELRLAVEHGPGTHVAGRLRPQGWRTAARRLRGKAAGWQSARACRSCETASEMSALD
jgi:hypothetical protein